MDLCHSHRLLPVLGSLLVSTYTDTVTAQNMLVARRARAAIVMVAPPAQLVAPGSRAPDLTRPGYNISTVVIIIRFLIDSISRNKTVKKMVRSCRYEVVGEGGTNW